MVAHTGADMIDLDYMVDLEQAADIVPKTTCLCGNFNPVSIMLQGSAEDIRAEVRRRKQISHRNNNFIAPGCEIPRDTPTENLVTLMEAIAEDWSNAKSPT